MRMWFCENASLVKTSLRFLAILLLCTGNAGAQSVPWQLVDTNGQQMHQPHRIAVTGDGNLVVSEPQRNRVRVFSENNLALINIPVHSPQVVGVTQDGLFLIGYATRIDALDRRGAVQFSLGNGVGEFSQLNDLTVAKSGNIFVSDGGEHCVKVYSNDGNQLFTFGEPGIQSGQFYFPAGLALNADESEIYVVDQGNSRVQVFDLQGNALREFGQVTYEEDNVGVFEETFSRPQSVVVDALNRVYVSDLTQNNIQVLTADGVFLDFIALDENNNMLFSMPMDMAFHKQQLIVTSTLLSEIRIFTISDLPVEQEDPETDPDPIELPNSYSLGQNYPNPFNAGTTISFTLGEAGLASLAVWNILGQEVIRLVDGELNAGPHHVAWNGRTRSGITISNGLYIYTLTVSNSAGEQIFSNNRKMIVLK